MEKGQPWGMQHLPAVRSADSSSQAVVQQQVLEEVAVWCDGPSGHTCESRDDVHNFSPDLVEEFRNVRDPSTERSAVKLELFDEGEGGVPRIDRSHFWNTRMHLRFHPAVYPWLQVPEAHGRPSSVEGCSDCKGPVAGDLPNDSTHFFKVDHHCM